MWLCLAVAFAFGIFLRLDDITSQVLTNDEWHPVHQLIWHTPRSSMRSLGKADYSIPLVLLYFAWMKYRPVTELVLRMPMIVAGIATLVGFPLALRKRLDDRIVVVFAALLATSPFLISYARIARPYALTVFGVYAAFACLARALVDDGRRLRLGWGCTYVVASGLVFWTHAVTGPMLIAPFAWLWWRTLRRRGLSWRQLLPLTGACAAAMALAIVPPIVGDPEALAGKSGTGHFALDAVIGCSFFWSGTHWPAIVIVFFAFAAMGSSILLQIHEGTWGAIGVGVTVVVIAITRPTDIHLPIVLARYLLPVVPLLLLACAAGVARAAERMRGPEPGWTAAIAVPFVGIHFASSPNVELLAQRPNSYAQDTYYQWDYRKDHNRIRTGFPLYPATSFWDTLATHEVGTLTVAVLPFRYSTWEFPAPLWERQSHQRVIPAYAWGACKDWNFGETPPNDRRFAFRNATHFDHGETLMNAHVDYLAYFVMPGWNGLSPPWPECVEWIRTWYGPPSYEDGAIMVWAVNGNAPLPSKRNP